MPPALYQDVPKNFDVEQDLLAIASLHIVALVS